MSLPKIDEIKDLSDQEITDQITAVKKDLFQLRFQKATRQMDKPHQFKHKRHRLAQLLTIERQRQLAAQSEE
jgi:large subunit ribosomal protein L29